MARQPRSKSRFCKRCGKAFNNIYDRCNECRAKQCEELKRHDIIVIGEGSHYDSRYRVICDHCGWALRGIRRKAGPKARTNPNFTHNCARA
jgi:hypothetical protein